MKDKRQEIISAAQAYFREKDIDETSLGEIARSADIAKGTLYYYYPRKELLVMAVFEQAMDQLLEQQPNVNETTDIATMISAFLEVMITRPDINRCFFYLLQKTIGNPSLRSEYQRALRGWAAKFKDIYAHRGLANPEQLAIVTGSMLTGATICWMIDPDIIHPEDISVVLTKLVQSAPHH